MSGETGYKASPKFKVSVFWYLCVWEARSEHKVCVSSRWPCGCYENTKDWHDPSLPDDQNYSRGTSHLDTCRSRHEDDHYRRWWRPAYRWRTCWDYEHVWIWNNGTGVVYPLRHLVTQGEGTAMVEGLAWGLSQPTWTKRECLEKTNHFLLTCFCHRQLNSNSLWI